MATKAAAKTASRGWVTGKDLIPAYPGEASKCSASRLMFESPLVFKPLGALNRAHIAQALDAITLMVEAGRVNRNNFVKVFFTDDNSYTAWRNAFMEYGETNRIKDRWFAAFFKIAGEGLKAADLGTSSRLFMAVHAQVYRSGQIKH